MNNIGQMMKQAQELQARLSETQQRLESEEVTGISGGGMVRVTLTGKGTARRIALDPKIVDPGEKEVLEDLIVAAVNDARAKVDARHAEEMAKLAGGLTLPPGMKLPF
jgi:DNA-binding YbaB/EbfC family protein